MPLVRRGRELELAISNENRWKKENAGLPAQNNESNKFQRRKGNILVTTGRPELGSTYDVKNIHNLSETFCMLRWTPRQSTYVWMRPLKYIMLKSTYVKYTG